MIFLGKGSGHKLYYHSKIVLAFSTILITVISTIQTPPHAFAGSPGTTLGIISSLMHASKDEVVPLTIIDNDLNTDANSIDSYVLNFGVGQTKAIVLSPGKSMLEIRVNDNAFTMSENLTLSFMETGMDTGVFAAKLNLTKIDESTNGGLKDGDTVDLKYTDLQVPDFDSEDSNWRVYIGFRKPTIIVLEPMESVVNGTRVTARGTLYDLETGDELAGKQISLSGTGVPAPAKIGITGGIKFTDPSGLSISQCSTTLPSGQSDGSDTPDIGDDHYPECLPDNNDSDGFNVKLDLHEGAKISFPSDIQIKTATLVLMGMGTNTVKVHVTENTGPGFDATSENYCPNISNLNLISDRGLKEIEIVDIQGGSGGATTFPQCSPITGIPTLGLARLETSNPDNNPSLQYNIDFEQGVPQILSNELVMSNGSFFITFDAPAFVKNGLGLKAEFAGDANYVPSQSILREYDTIAPTAAFAFGGGGEPTSGISPDSDGGITTISCTSDSDKDGLCNSWESTGSTAGIPYNDGGIQYYKLSTNAADLHLNNPDIWVEVDCMSGYCPTPQTANALDRVKTVFLGHNIYLHYSIDNLSIPVANDLHVWLDTDGNSTNDFYNIKQNWFGTTSEQGTLLLKDNSKLLAKSQAYHYALFAKSIGACGPSGLAEIAGNDLIITLGCGFTGTAGSEDEQAGTFMHELGHNLNLDHGGPRAYLTLPAGYQITGSQNNAIGDNGPAGSDTSRSYTVSGFGVTTPGASSGTMFITTTITFVNTGQTALDPGVTTVGTVTRTMPGTITVNSITPILSTSSSGSNNVRQVTLKVVFTTTGATSGTTNGALGTFTIPLTVTNNNAVIKTTGGLLTPNYSPNMNIDISSTDYVMNCKTVYPSVMSYSQQFHNYFEQNGVPWQLTYSNWTGTSLVENSLDESAPVSGNANYFVYYSGGRAYVQSIPAPSGVDWDKTHTGIVQVDLNAFGISGCPTPGSWESEKAFNDWSNLFFDFKKGKASIDGAYTYPSVSLVYREADHSVPEFPWPLFMFSTAIAAIIIATRRYWKSPLDSKFG